MTDAMIRDAETGQFTPAERRDIAADFVAEQYDVSLDELVSAYEQVNGTLRGKFMFG